MIIKCPHCKNDDSRMIEYVVTWRKLPPNTHVYLCLNCSKEFQVKENEPLST